MSEILLYIQKNVYRISLAAGVFLGFAAALFAASLTAYVWNVRPAAPAANTVSGGKPPATGRPYQPKETFYPVITGNLFRERDSSQKMPSEEIPAEKSGEFTLIGVLAGDRAWARAAVQIDGEQEANEYRTGQEAAGYVIQGIYADSIRVKKGQISFLVKVGEKTSELRAKLSAPAETVQQPKNSDPGPVSARDATRITISRDKLLALTRDQSELYKNKFTPFMRGDRIMGLQFILVPENNFLYELGLRSGDILRRINGQPMENTQRMIEFYQSLSTANRITVDIERAGKILPYEILIQ